MYEILIGVALQELIAPLHVTFCNAEWEYLGSKNTLSRPLTKITGVDEYVLMARDTLPSYTIARRLSWAAHRQTSREEDRAYSLLGIFNIRMPLIYGERHNAFIRLQEEVIKDSTDHSIFAWEYQLGDMPQTDLIFATGPHQFSHAAKIVPRRGTWLAVDPPYRLTNRGLRFDGLCMYQAGNEWLAVLNCRYEDDLKGPIALRLCREDNLSSSLRALLHENDFWVRTSPDPWDDTVERTVVIDRSQSLVPTRSLNLLRSHPALEVWDGIPSYSKIWLCEDEASPIHFDIINAYPGDVWNVEIGVLCLSGSEVTTSIKIRDELENIVVVGLRLSEDKVEDEHRDSFGRVTTRGYFDAWLRLSAEGDCQTMCEYLDDREMRDSCEATAKVNRMLYRARVGNVQRIGGHVYEIRVTREDEGPRERKRLKRSDAYRHGIIPGGYD